MRDPYLYTDSEVLKNKFDVMDDMALRGLEADYVVLRLSEIAADEPINMFNFASLCGLHYRIFQDIFEWAGKSRIINIEKAETVLKLPLFQIIWLNFGKCIRLEKAIRKLS